MNDGSTTSGKKRSTIVLLRELFLVSMTPVRQRLACREESTRVSIARAARCGQGHTGAISDTEASNGKR